MKKSHWLQAQILLLAALIVILPSNLFLKFAEQSGYVHGLLVDYLLPKLYFSDLFMIAILFCWLGEFILTKKRISAEQSARSLLLIIFSLSLWGLLLLIQVVSPRPLSSTWFAVKLLELVTFGWWVYSHRFFLKCQLIGGAVMIMLGLQTAVSTTQFFTQHAAFPSYLWLGESRLDQRAGVVHGVFGSRELLLPYGTTAHPNILAGVISIGILMLLSISFTRPGLQWLRKVIVLLGICILLLTQSWSAGLTLVIGGVVLWKKTTLLQFSPKLLSLALGIGFVFTPVVIHAATLFSPQNPSLLRRDLLNQAAVQLWKKFPVSGVGLNAFTAQLEYVLPATEAVRFVQPAHHLGLLFLAETGLTGLLLLSCWLFCLYSSARQAWQRAAKPLFLVGIIFLPIAGLDHYLWTNQVGQLLLVLGGLWLIQALKVPETPQVTQPAILVAARAIPKGSEWELE